MNRCPNIFVLLLPHCSIHFELVLFVHTILTFIHSGRKHVSLDSTNFSFPPFHVPTFSYCRAVVFSHFHIPCVVIYSRQRHEKKEKKEKKKSQQLGKLKKYQVVAIFLPCRCLLDNFRDE